MTCTYTIRDLAEFSCFEANLLPICCAVFVEGLLELLDQRIAQTNRNGAKGIFEAR